MRPIAALPGLLAVLLTLSACGVTATAPTARVATGVKANARAPYAQVVAPKDVPPELVRTALGPAQATADDASRRRKIDFFTLPSNPVGLQIGQGPTAAQVLSFIGTSKTDGDLNIELRAFVGGGQVGVSLNYSGETTQSRLGIGLNAPTVTRVEGTTFELIQGLPGNGVSEAYGGYLDHLGESLVQRYQAQPFHFDDTPIVFAVHQGDAVTGFLFTNQGNQLVLGDRKYADVQNVACYTADATLAAAYTIVGFNRKTKGPGAAPVYHLEHDADFGTIARCGSL